jgi:hypothetical protein
VNKDSSISSSTTSTASADGAIDLEVAEHPLDAVALTVEAPAFKSLRIASVS